LGFASVGCGPKAEPDVAYGGGVVRILDQDLAGCPGGDGGVWSIGFSGDSSGQGRVLFVGGVRYDDGVRGECGGRGMGGLNGQVARDGVRHGSAVHGAERVFAEVGGGLLVGDWLWLLGLRFLSFAGLSMLLRGRWGGRFVPGGRREMPEGHSRRGGRAGAEGVPFVHVTRGGGSQVGRWVRWRERALLISSRG
jgi:hypothetical protein